MAISPIPHWFEGSEYTHKVAACIMKYGPISRITLAQILGLSQGAVSRITSDLIYAGVIEETPMAAGHGGKLPKDFLRKSAQKSIQKENTERRGRPQTGLRIIANARTFVGMKINTTHITAVTVNALGQIVTGCHDLPLDDDSPESVVDVIKQLTMDCADEAIMAGLPSPCAVGVSLGGHIVDDSMVTFAPFLHWSKPVEFSALIQEATGLPTGIYNDIDSLVVDACMFGSGVGLNSFAVVTIGIGVGYSLTVNGEPVNNPDKSYGLVGHILVDPDGPRCISGHKGCATCLTDNSIATEYSKIIGRPATFDEFAAAARQQNTGHESGEPHLLPVGHADRDHRQSCHARQNHDRRRIVVHRETRRGRPAQRHQYVPAQPGGAGRFRNRRPRLGDVGQSRRRAGDSAVCGLTTQTDTADT